MRILYRLLGLSALLLGSAVFASAQAGSAQPPETNQAVAKALEKAMTPGEGQKKLEFMVGTFDAKIRTWVNPSDPPSEDAGVMVGKFVLGGRYIQMMLAANVAGQPFEGIGYAGFDNTTKKYVATFMDSASTGMEWYTGGFDASGGQATLKASVADPGTGKPSPLEMRLTLNPAGDHVTELWGEGLGHTMFKMMELTYTRRK